MAHLHQFEVYKDVAGEHRWRLRAPNGKIVADSGESYKSARSARTAITSLERAFKHGFRATLVT